MSKVIGIDLGTTFSAIASLDDLGNPEVLASIEDNRKITASAIYINENNVTVGDKALNHIKEEPKKVNLRKEVNVKEEDSPRDVNIIYHNFHYILDLKKNLFEYNLHLHHAF